MAGYTSYDASLIKTAKPKTTDGQSSATDAIDLGAISNIGVRSETFELELQVPAIAAADTSGATLAFSIQGSDDSTFSANVETVVTTTVGNGSASSATKIRYRPTLKSPRYWRAICVTDASGSGASVDSDVAAKEFALAYVC